MTVPCTHDFRGILCSQFIAEMKFSAARFLCALTFRVVLGDDTRRRKATRNLAPKLRTLRGVGMG
jgi:hypothetical protein